MKKVTKLEKPWAGELLVFLVYFSSGYNKKKSKKIEAKYENDPIIRDQMANLGWLQYKIARFEDKGYE